MKYRKRPVVVDAYQWFPGPNVVGVYYDSPDILPSGELSKVRSYVITIHGQRAYLEPGDWVITEPGDGTRYYPCKPEIFEATYEPVHDDGE